MQKYKNRFVRKNQLPKFSMIVESFRMLSLMRLGKPGCSFYRTCNDCQSDPECGWCDDGSGTGLGKCLPGGNHGNYDVSEMEPNGVLSQFGLISQIQGTLHVDFFWA